MNVIHDRPGEPSGQRPRVPASQFLSGRDSSPPEAMDSVRYGIRPFADSDVEAMSRIQSRLEPNFPRSADELRHRLRAMMRPGLFQRLLAVEDRYSSSCIATGFLFHMAWSHDPDQYRLEIGVDPEHQHRGIGRELEYALEREAADRRARVLYTSTRAEDARSVRFFQRRGFAERRRTWVSRLDLSGARLPITRRSPADWATEGLELTTLAEEGAARPEVQEQIYRLDLETSRDVPRLGPPVSFSLEQYVELAFDGPGFLPEGMFLARAGDLYVAMSSLERLSTEPETLQVGFTGTLRPYRGRGLASELKARAVEFARAHGYRYLRTVNDSANRPIWSINEKLGFRPITTWIDGEKRLGPPH